jgi:anti-sigma B factor antagonist
MDFWATTSCQAARAHVAVRGELDVMTVPQVRCQIDDAIAQGCTHFTVDVAGVTFIDAAGLGVFARLHTTATRLGGTVTFVATSPRFLRVCGLTQLTELFELTSPTHLCPDDMARGMNAASVSPPSATSECVRRQPSTAPDGR